MNRTLASVAAPAVIDTLHADHEHVSMMYDEYRFDAPVRQRASIAACVGVAIELLVAR